MTVCLAAICESGGGIVSVSDKMVSYGSYTTADSLVMKVTMVHDDWMVLYAGNDTSRVQPILSAVELKLRKLKTRTTAQRVQAAFETVYREEYMRQAEQGALGRYDATMKWFLHQGRHRLGDGPFGRLFDKIERIRIGCEFLVYGFEPVYDFANLFKVCEDGTIEDHSGHGF